MVVTSSLRDYIYIDNSEQFRWLAVELANEPLIAIDTESNGMYAYEAEVCLVQLSTREADYIVDPLVIEDLSPLGALMANPDIETILHAAEYDLMLLKRDYDFSVCHLYDTMVAARLTGHTYHGLANMLERYFDVSPDKRHQHDNWSARPLPEESLRYAQMDTHYLPRLRDLLTDMLKDMGRWEEAQELFREAAQVPPADPAFDPDGFWKLGHGRRLGRRQMGLLQEIYLLRERLAQSVDVPVHKIFSNRVMFKIVKAEPTSIRELSQIRGMPPSQVRRYGDQILDALAAGRRADLPESPPLPEPPSPFLLERYKMLQQWRKHKGAERGVESDLVLPKSMLWELAHTLPTTREGLAQLDGLGPQRLALYADDLLAVLKTLD